MSAVASPRLIVNRRDLTVELDVLAGRGRDLAQLRPQILGVFRKTLENGRREIRERFARHLLGTDAVRSLSYLMDQLVRAIHEFASTKVFPVANPTAGEHMAVAAVGGYGRGELAPYSDVDLLFVLAYKSTPNTEQVV